VSALALTRRAEKAAPYLTILATLFSGWVAFSTGTVERGARFLPQPAMAAEFTPRFTATWLTIPPNFHIALGVNLDALAWLMVLVVCFVSALVQVYSIGYMAGEAGYARYFAYLGLFTASMLGLVVADNLFQLYVCWELVGICSYLLIGFWWQKPSAANAAKKAFVVTRFGDVGFMLGVLLLASAAGSFQFTDVTQTVHKIESGEQTAVAFVSADTFLWLAPLLLFCGAVGKSAQFPLHVWLPDAMEGPTPVSALIHAATMVAAGVYMVARLFPLFAVSGVAMDTVLLIGAITAFLAATIALVQTDIKKVMAYSTVSQLGYMMLGLGAGGKIAGMFHLTTHAMFKALLFLTAGSVIHALQHQAHGSPRSAPPDPPFERRGDPNDMRDMGGMYQRMPYTAVTCGIGVLALAGIPPLSGFWSKDAILGVAWESPNPVAKFALVVGLATTGLTAFYTARMWLMTFSGRPRSEAATHAHESPLVMLLPLWILAIPSVLLGILLHQNDQLARFLGSEHVEPMHAPLVSLTFLLSSLGLLLAVFLFAKSHFAADPVEKLPAPVYNTLAGLWGIDAFWNAVGARGTLAVGRMVAWFDRHVVDGVMNGIAWLCGLGGRVLRRTATGQAQAYTAAMLAAIVLVIALLIWYESQAGPPQNIVAAPGPATLTEASAKR